MTQFLTSLLKQIPLLKGDTISIILHSSDTDPSYSLIPDPPVLDIHASRLPDDWYIRIPRSLASAGVRNIILSSDVQWIGDDPAPAEVVITDHIACHVPSPLTGSADARFGQVFIDMRDAYSYERSPGDAPVILWHSLTVGDLADEELSVAKSAGCRVAGHSIAPWAICARAAGCTFHAAVKPVT